MFKQALFIVALTASASHAAPCAVTEQDLLGAWALVGDSGFFEQMEFQRKGAQQEFNSWLHDRPETSGAQWQLDSCKLTIRDGSSWSETFSVSRRGKRMVLTAANGRSASTFRRVEDSQK
jgi:hypothetical protein